MRQDICSIPISEIFEPKDGCPFCRMRDMLEDRMATYITGAAMMEPDVRLETNRLGFCKLHFDEMLLRGSRLSVALILESLLAQVQTDVFQTPLKKSLALGDHREHSCFICENIEKNMQHLCATVLKLWQSEEEFRKLYREQSHICLPHSNLILNAAAKMPKKNFIPFSAETKRLSENYLQVLEKDVTHFCRMFDYRNKGGDWENSRDAIERSIAFLTARQVTVTAKSDGKNR
ncbi:MAG: DUF6062 family protein [Oscillospiraceae bacterium]